MIIVCGNSIFLRHFYALQMAVIHVILVACLTLQTFQSEPMPKSRVACKPFHCGSKIKRCTVKKNCGIMCG